MKLPISVMTFGAIHLHNLVLSCVSSTSFTAIQLWCTYSVKDTQSRILNIPFLWGKISCNWVATRLQHEVYCQDSVFPYTRLNGYTLQRSCLRHYATSRRVAGSIPDEVIGFFNIPNLSSRTMALESTQILSEMSFRNLYVGKGRPARKADNLTAIYEPTV
jgi:hypothetical protein